MEDLEETAELKEVRRIRKISSLKRENRRLRHSVSFQLGLHLTDAVRKPWKLLLLPLTFPLLCLQIGMTRLGKKSASTEGFELDYEVQPRKNAIVLFPTNGVGFGHFTRMYSVAREMRRQDPEMEIIFSQQCRRCTYRMLMTLPPIIWRVNTNTAIWIHRLGTCWLKKC